MYSGCGLCVLLPGPVLRLSQPVTQVFTDAVPNVLGARSRLMNKHHSPYGLFTTIGFEFGHYLGARQVRL